MENPLAIVDNPLVFSMATWAVHDALKCPGVINSKPRDRQ